MSWHRKPLLGVDLETTGVDPETDRIVTAAVVRYGGPLPTVGRSWLADPGVEIPEEAAAIHGVSTAYAREHGTPAAVVVGEVTALIAESVAAGMPVVAINAVFDLTMLDREARRHGVRPLFEYPVTPRVLDPRVLDKQADKYRKGRRTLTDLCRHYCVQLDAAHTAQADAVAACAVTWKIGNRHRAIARTSIDVLHARQVMWARQQAEGLRDYYARTEGLEDQAAGVRMDWPLTPVMDGAVR